MTVAQESDAEPMEPTEEAELETEEFLEDPGNGPSVMPWLLPVLIIVAFFAFVALLVLLVV